MKLKTFIFSVLSLHFLLPGFTAAGEEALVIRENSYKNRIYHHTTLHLEPSALLDQEDITDPDIGYRFSDGGLFEIYLTPSTFGEMAQNCSRVIVRMPWTNPSVSGSAEKIKAKKALFDQIERLRHNELPQVQVALELDPYLSGNYAEGYQLTQCLAFFRTSFGAYITHANTLQ